MKHLLCGAAFLALVAEPIGAVEQSPRLDRPTSVAQEAGMGLLAATANVIYFPLRLVVTTVTAGVGGFTGWMTGGDEEAACTVWASTDGQAFLNPRILEGRERLHFGHRTDAACELMRPYNADLYYY